MSKLCLVPSALALLAAVSPAQTVLFHEGFEDGLAGWTASGLWNSESASDGCGATVAPFPEGTNVAYYGIDGACNFDTGAVPNHGALTSPWIDLPVGAGSISAFYWTWSSSEYCWENWDVHTLFVDVEGGPVVTVPFCTGSQATAATLPWHERRVDLSALAGSRIRLRFDFDTADTTFNHTLGWFLDDVDVVVEPGSRICPSPGLQSGCPCAAPLVPVAGGCFNSTDQSAVLSSGGTTSIGADTLELRVEHMPPNASAILTQATASASQIPFGDGVRCVGGSLLRMGSLQASNGVATWPPSGAPRISATGVVPPEGGTRYYFVFYRDVLTYCTTATFNATDTQRIVWTP